jgi:hypothetical protein
MLVPSQFGFVSRDVPALAPLVSFLRVAVPALGFAAGGAIGGSSLDLGRRGVLSSAAAMSVAGLGLSLSSPLMTGLTGFEDRLTVLLFAAIASGGSFAAAGALLALLLAPRSFVMLAVGFLAGGAAGGVIVVLPAVLAPAFARWPADLQLFGRLACSLAGLLGPFAAAGAVTGRAGEKEEGRV